MLRLFTFCLLATLASACSDMDFKVNDRVVYTPKPLFTDFDIADEALRSCLELAITDNKITAAAQLQQLNCPGTGIEKLDGLSTFTGVTRLNLSSNAIGDLTELSALSALQILALDDNDIVNPVPLFQLTALQQLNLAENSGLHCPASSAFALVEKVRLPNHCNP